MTTQSYQQIILKTLRHLTPTAIEQTIQVVSDYTAGSGTLTVDQNSASYKHATRPGVRLAVGLNILLVQREISSGVLQVVGGFQGSTDADITGSCTDPTAMAFINPKFSQFEISDAVNDELDHLSAPDVGLGQILSTDITYIPAFVGYALPATFSSASSKVLEVSYKEAIPLKRYPLIRFGEYRVLRNQTDGDFPNGAGIRIFRGAWPGLPIHVQFLSPFTRLGDLSDDLLACAGVPQSMQDIVAMGAALRLAPDREVQRNAMQQQPDPRKAPEVPAGAQMNAAGGIMQRYLRRINAEAGRIRRAFPNAER